jgi:hypothetical protein
MVPVGNSKHPMYSMDMRLDDFDLFLKVKQPLQDKQFRQKENIQQAIE